MGIARGAARLFLKEASVRPYTGSVLQLGRQDIYFSKKDFIKWADEQKVSLNVDAPIRPNKHGSHIGDIDDVSFFKLLGFQFVFSADFSDYESADFILDLNLPAPEYLHEKFDVIFDGGTLEHCFNTFQVLQNIFLMLKKGGRVIHVSPSSNHVDHGFYMFSPTLFYDYYSTNNWQVRTSYIFEYTQLHYKDPWSIYKYTPGCIDHLSFGGFRNGKLLGIWFIAEKNSQSTGNIIPQQGYYLKAWNQNKRDEEGSPPNLFQSTLTTLKNKSALFNAATKHINYLLCRIQLRVGYRRMPPIVAKF